MTAERGLFNVERANLRTGATELSAVGRFSFEGDTDLRLSLDSSDAAELQNVAVSTGLLPDIEEKVKDFDVELLGALIFKAR